MRSLRSFGLYVIPASVITWLFFTDPDSGAATRDMLQGVATGVIAVTLSYICRKIVLPYIKLEDFARSAKTSGTGAGLVFLGVIIFMAALLMMFAPRAHAGAVDTYIPAGAYTYAPVLRVEQLALWPTHPLPSALASLVEQESCISLKHSKCWNPASRLKTDREEGAGFGQITRAYRADGSIRFDALADARNLDPTLNAWSWSNVYKRPDLQLRAIVAMNRDCYRRMTKLVTAPVSALQMCDAAYNGGYAGVQSERRACGQRAGCDPQRWFKNVEMVCLKSKTKWKGYGASACDINREHVHMVLVVRRPKYAPLMGGM